MSDRYPLVLLGRTIGTHDGWDGDMDAMVFYAFKPCNVLSTELPEGDLTADYQKGLLEYYTDDGKLYKSFDMLEKLQMVQRDRPKE
jgi:hypothetical protein